jgi:hypothetical protein
MNANGAGQIIQSEKKGVFLVNYIFFLKNLKLD